MIIGSWDKLEIGKKYEEGQITDIYKNHHKACFIVVREATFEEYNNCIIEMGGNLVTRKDMSTAYFYEILAD